MSFETLSALALFAFVSSITPGPNNLMLMTSGAHFGLRRTLPHMAGVGLGFVFMLIAVGAGIGAMLERWPLLGDGLRLACLAYLSLLVWRIATAPPPGSADPRSRPLTFLEAAAFQWLNPKGWAMALTTITAYIEGGGHTALLSAAAVFGVVNISSVSTWAVAGTHLHRLLTSPARARVFNLAMATLVVASAAPVVFV